MKTRWIFMAYKNEKDYPDKPYFLKIFKNHIQMKIFSGKHAAESNNKEYCSTYVKIEI